MKARTEISAGVPLSDVAMQLAGLGDGNTLVALLDLVADVVQRNYAHSENHSGRILVFLDRTDKLIDGNTAALLKAMIERAEKND